jgi:peptide/nickel transport system substrate-binding protein
MAISRRNALRVATATAALGGLAPSGVGAQEARPQRGGVLTVAMDLEPNSLDPIMGNAVNSDPNVFNQLYDKLYVLDRNGEFVPRLAESWEFAPDNLSVTFRLRRGVEFHDGTAFDAAAVKFNIDRVAAPGSRAPASSFATDIAGADVIDAGTVRVRFRQVSGAAMTALAIQSGMIVSPTALRERGDAFARNPVGTGPFRFREWRGGDRIVVERNPRYWRQGSDGMPLPYLDGVITRFINNTTVKLVEARAGSVQLTDAIQVKDFDQVEREQNLALVDHPQGVHIYLTFNSSRPPFNNLHLRRAISYAINRNALERVITRGQGLVTATYWSPASWVHDPSLEGYAYRPDLARELATRAGHRGPLTLSVIQRDPDTQVAQILQAQLRQVGLELRVEVLERQAWLSKILGRQHDMGLLRGQVPRPDPDITFTQNFSPRGSANYSAIEDDALQAAVDAGRASLDRAVRRTHYIEAQRILLDKAYYGFLFTMPIRDVRRRNVHGLAREFGSQWLLDEVWLAR